MKLYKKEILLKQNYLFHRNLQIQKFTKTSPKLIYQDAGRGPDS